MNATYNKLQVDSTENNFESLDMQKVSFLRRISNVRLPFSRPLAPLFEAVANSIHSIQELDISDGKIDIKVIREDRGESSLFEGASDTNPILGFEIEDNGIGFNADNFGSFETSDSDYKPGAKGIGRFLWLKAFDEVVVESVYEEAGGYYKRKFDFRLTKQAIENESVDPAEVERKTIVTLLGYKSKYQAICPRHLALIAAQIIEHFLINFLRDACLTITLSDGTETYVLNEEYEKTVKAKSDVIPFNVGTEEFQMVVLRLYGSLKNDTAHFCAGERSVERINLEKRIPDLSVRLRDGEGKPFRVAAYIWSPFLDDNANAERTAFDIEQHASELLPDEITFDKIEAATVEQIKANLAEQLRPIAENKVAEYTRYVKEEAPEFRTLVKLKPELIEELPAGLSKEKLDSELHRLKFGVNAELQARADEFLRKDFDEVTNKDEYLRIYSEFFSQLSDFNTDDLAKYVIHRKSIIQLLEKGLSPTETGAYYPEAFVHNLIFPMGTTSDQVDEKQNLWMIDERLSFHDFLTSDKSVTSQENLQSDSRKEPDIIVFNKFDKAIAYAEPGHQPLDSIVIVEFKRPMRKGYDEDDENPVMQVTNLIKDIRDSKILDKDGRPMDVLPTTPFYVYIVCDITKRIKTLLEINHGFTPTPDPRGYFTYYQHLNAYIEVVSYNKMVDDAKKRNRVLFTKLNLPTT